MRTPYRPWPDALDGERGRALRTRIALVLGAVLVIGAFARVATYPRVHDAQGFVLRDGDGYYHLRRVRQTLEHGGRLPMFDPLLAYPRGLPLQWHGGYDLPLAGAVALICGTAPDRNCLESVAVWSTPLLGSAGILLVHALGAEIAGPAVGLLAALLFAVYPWSAGSARLGSVDHHVLEPLLPALWLLWLARGRWRLAGLACAWALAAFPTALASILATAVAALGAHLVARLWPAPAATRDDGGARPAETAIAVAPMLGVTTVLALPLVALSPFATRLDPNGLSLLHLGVLGLAAALAFALERALRASLAWTLRALGAALITTAAVAFALAPTLARFSSSAGLWSEVVQLRPLARTPAGLAVCFALSLGLGAYGLWRARALEARLDVRALRLLAVLQPLVFLPGVLQMRHLMPASAPFSVMLAFALADGSAALRRRVLRERPRTQRLAAACALAMLLLALLPALDTVRPRPAPSWPRALIHVLQRARQLSAPHGRGAVLADWRFGHHVLYFTELPVVASPFMRLGGAEDDPNVAARRALLSRTPALLLNAMDALRCRYLLLSEPFDVTSAAASLGRSPPAHVAARALLDGTLPTPPGLSQLASEGTARFYLRTRP